MARHSIHLSLVGFVGAIGSISLFQQRREIDQLVASAIANDKQDVTLLVHDDIVVVDEFQVVGEPVARVQIVALLLRINHKIIKMVQNGSR